MEYTHFDIVFHIKPNVTKENAKEYIVKNCYDLLARMSKGTGPYYVYMIREIGNSNNTHVHALLSTPEADAWDNALRKYSCNPPKNSYYIMKYNNNVKSPERYFCYMNKDFKDDYKEFLDFRTNNHKEFEKWYNLRGSWYDSNVSSVRPIDSTTAPLSGGLS